MSQPTDPNPYASPSLPASPSFPDVSGGMDHRLQRTIRDFHNQSLALGVAWIVMALLALGLIAFAVGTTASQGQSPLLIAAAVVVVFGIIWITVGTFTCLKHLWAVYTGLVLSYISLVGNLLSLNLCAILILLAIIVQAHRVLGFAKQIQAAGLPLTTRV
jgi:hypothetical protein